MFSAKLPIKLLSLVLLLAAPTAFVPSAQATTRTLADTLRLRVQLDAQIVFLTAEIELANSRLVILQRVVKIDPSVQGVLTNLINVIQNDQAQLSRIQQEHAIVVQLSAAQLKLRELQIQVQSDERRVNRLDNVLQGHPLLRSIADRRIRQLNNGTANDQAAISALESQIASLQQQLNTFLNGG
jgi:chromosome segregation ATPase